MHLDRLSRAANAANLQKITCNIATWVQRCTVLHVAIFRFGLQHATHPFRGVACCIRIGAQDAGARKKLQIEFAVFYALVNVQFFAKGRAAAEGTC